MEGPFKLAYIDDVYQLKRMIQHWIKVLKIREVN